MVSVLDIILTAVQTLQSDGLLQQLEQYTESDFTDYVLEQMRPYFETLIINNNFEIIQIIINYLYTFDINHLDSILIKDIYVYSAIHNLPLMNRIWNELELAERTYLLPHNSLSVILESIDNTTVFETIINHIVETDDCYEEDTNTETWILDTVLVNGRYNCLRKAFELFPNIQVTVTNIDSSVLGGSIECFELLYTNYRLTLDINPRKMFEYAAGYGGLPMLLHLMRVYRVNTNTNFINRMFALALAGGRMDTLVYIHDILGCRFYNQALEYGTNFNNMRNNELDNLRGHELAYYEKKWFISSTYENDYDECVNMIDKWRES